MNEAAMDTVFQALAHQTRRRVLDIVRDEPGCTVGAVCARFTMSRIAVLKHIRVLEDAGLLTSEKRGRERLLRFNVTPIQLIHDRWSDEYSGFWAGALADLKYRVEMQERKKKRVRATKKAHTSKKGGAA